MLKILFVCTGNTCRSVIAEYLARHRSDPNCARFESAGIRLVPTENSRNAIETLRLHFEIDASAHVPREIGQLELSNFDVIVAIDGKGTNKVFRCLKQRGVVNEKLVRWKIDDPYGPDQSEYDRCALETVKRLSTLRKSLNFTK